MIWLGRKLTRLGERREGGFNLVEVLVAMALLGTVMIAIMSLFFVGRRNVYSGRQMTKAIAIGNRVLEDLSLLTKQDIYYGVFNIADTASGGTVTIMGKSYTHAKVRTSKPSIVTPANATEYTTEKSGGPLYLSTKWVPQLGNDLQDGSVTLVLQPVGSSTQFGAAEVLRLTVLIYWKEESRQRSLTLTSTKAY